MTLDESGAVLPDEKENNVLTESDGQTHEVPISKGISTARSILLVLVLASASFLNTTIAQACVIVLPTIGRDIGIPHARQQWVISASSLAFACTLLTWGRIGDVCGRPRVFQTGLILVTISCLISPFAPEEVSFDIFRALQGLGGAASTPTAIGIISATYPPGQTKIYAISAFSAGFPLGNVLGNVLGGIIGQYLSWKWIFWILCIFSLIMSVLAFFVIPQPNTHRTTGDESCGFAKSLSNAWRELNARMDWIGAFLITGALVLLLVPLTEGNIVGWNVGWIIALLVVGFVLLCLFVAWQLRREKRQRGPPLMKLSVFSNGTFSASQIIMFLFGAAFNNFLVFATFFYQDYQNLSVIDTTLRFLPSGITGLLTVFVSSQILSLVKGSYILVWSNICVSIACLLFAVPIPPEETYWAYGFPAMVLITLGADTIYPCLALFVTKSVSAEDQAIGAATFQTIGQVGRTVGLAIATAIQVAVTENHSNTIGDGTSPQTMSEKAAAVLMGYRAAEYFNFACGVIAVGVAIFAFRGAGKVGST